MKIGMIGSGDVGKRLSVGLKRLNHEVMMGTRDKIKLKEWSEKEGRGIYVGNLQEAAKFGEIIFICTAWSGTENAINLAGKENIKGKIVIDVTNPLDFSKGMPPRLDSSPGNSAGENIQKLLSESKVVKAFNTVGNSVMVNAKREGGDPTLFICGNSEGKKFVSELSKKWGWKDIIDLGEIDKSYIIECLAMIVIDYGIKNNSWSQAFKLIRK